MPPPCLPALLPNATSWHQFVTVHSLSSVRFVSIRRTAFRVPSLLSEPQTSCASFVFMHLRIANFATPFFSQPYKMPGVCSPLALSSACSFPRACITFLLFDTLLLRRYYQFFSSGTPSARFWIFYRNRSLPRRCVIAPPPFSRNLARPKPTSTTCRSKKFISTKSGPLTPSWTLLALASGSMLWASRNLLVPR